MSQFLSAEEKKLLNVPVDRTLWHGKFYDGKISFLLPPAEHMNLICEDLAEDLAEDEVVILYVVISADTDLVGHVHVPAPVEVAFVTGFADMLAAITDKYFAKITEQKLRAIANGNLH